MSRAFLWPVFSWPYMAGFGRPLRFRAPKNTQTAPSAWLTRKPSIWILRLRDLPGLSRKTWYKSLVQLLDGVISSDTKWTIIKPNGKNLTSWDVNISWPCGLAQLHCRWARQGTFLMRRWIPCLWISLFWYSLCSIFMLLFVSVDGPVPDAKKPFFPVLKNVGVISTSCDSCGFPKNSSGARQFQTCAKSARAMLVSPRSRRIAGTSYVQVQMPAMCGVSRGITVSIIRITPAGKGSFFWPRWPHKLPHSCIFHSALCWP